MALLGLVFLNAGQTVHPVIKIMIIMGLLLVFVLPAFEPPAKPTSPRSSPP
jgi:hypothetical protein